MSFSPIRSVVKALSIIEVLTGQNVASGEVTLAEICERTGIPSTTTRNLLRTLEYCGYARKVAHGRYREGSRCYQLFHNEGVMRRLCDVARSRMGDLVTELNESLVLVTLLENRRVELLRVKAPDEKPSSPVWHANANPYQSRTVRVFLAWAKSETVSAFLQENGFPKTRDWPECGTTPEELDKCLAAIRARGSCCIPGGEYYGIAVPVLNANGEIMASLGCYARRDRTDRVRALGIVNVLHECAAAVCQDM